MAKKMKGKEAEKEREMGQGCDGCKRGMDLTRTLVHMEVERVECVVWKLGFLDCLSLFKCLSFARLSCSVVRLDDGGPHI